MKEFIGDLWMETDSEGRVKLGFSRRFIEEKLGECFHVMQADMRTVKKGGPLMVIETNDGLRPLKSPLSGTILNFNAKARNFPDRLVEDDIIVDILPEGVKLPEKSKQPKVVITDNLWNEMPFNQVPPPARGAQGQQVDLEAIRRAQAQQQAALNRVMEDHLVVRNQVPAPGRARRAR